MKQYINVSKRFVAGSAIVLAATASVFGQEKPAAAAAASTSAPEHGTINSFFNGQLPDAIGKSKLSANVRLRWEDADQSNLSGADAVTLRTRFGITTAPLYGFQGMIEAENITILNGTEHFNAAGANANGVGKTIIADPATTEINQAWASYTYTNYLTLKAGRQRIVLDNHRFIGDVGWRQNQQTFDAASFETRYVQDFDLYYAYLWDIHRVFGNVSGLPAASPNRDFDSASHVINLSYSGWKYGKFTAYSYLLDLKNGAGPAQSSATYGGSFVGSAPVYKQVKVDYRGEFAWQTDYADSALRYGAQYYNLEGGVNVKPFVVGGGYEVLGSDNNRAPAGGLASFRTPLATLHAFNGWADVFLTTPPAGLRDYYGFAQVTVPKIDLPIRFVYHKFDADKGGADFGQEFDVVATKKLGKYWTAIAKFAHYDGKAAVSAAFPANTDVDKFWLEANFVY